MSERRPLEAVPELARTAVLPGPPRRRPQRVTTHSPEVPTQATADKDRTDSASERETEPAERRRAPARRANTPPAATVRPTTLSLPAGLIAEVRERARRERISQSELLLDALSATQDELERLFKGEQERTRTASDGLFLRRPPRTRPGATETLATLSLRLLGENLARIDDLVDRVGAPSRSAMCAAALRTYLET